MKVSKHLIVILSVLAFVLVFYENGLGLNVLIFGLLTVLLFAFKSKVFWRQPLSIVITSGYLLSSLFYSLYGSPLALVVAFTSFALLFGIQSEVGIRNILNALGNVPSNYGQALRSFFHSFKRRRKTRFNINLGKNLRIIFIPCFVILLFIGVYSMGSSFFSDAIAGIGEELGLLFSWIGKYIELKVVLVVFLGFLFSIIHALGLTRTSWGLSDANANDNLLRKRNKKGNMAFKALDLKIEYKSGVFLFCVLNLMLIFLLYLEMKNVWFGFEWEGEFLKESVHRGTGILILSIVISMLVTLYYFRKNLNFLSGNKFLKYLAFIWVGLNLVLVVSVFVRNHYYIKHFGLAHLRIGVLFFLVLCVFGLITIFLKVAWVKSSYYLFRTNALAAYIGIVALCAFNWDTIIAKYNFSKYDSAFLHLPFMASLSDKALPYLIISDDKIETIENAQKAKIPFVKKRGYFKDVNYSDRINYRITKFMKEYEAENSLEHVWAESKAYQKLKEMGYSAD